MIIMNSIVILSIILALSIAANAFFFWYNRVLLSRLAFISNNLDDLAEMVASYRAHLTKVYEMEMFYGDETLKFLLAHTNDLKEILEDYEDILYITEPIQELESELLEQKEEQINESQTKNNEENVFYAGTRRRDS